MICSKSFIGILFFVFVGISYSENYPIIFIHGHEDNPTDTTGWKTWNNPHSAMWRTLNEQYGGYTAGNLLNCNEGSTSIPTGSERHKIYSFRSYFNGVLKETENTKREKRNMKVIALEWLGGATLSSASWYLSMQMMPEEGWDDPARVALIGLLELNLGAPLSSSIGATFVGKMFNQDGSFWLSLLWGFVGSWAGALFAEENKIGLGIVLGSSVGAVMGYNLEGQDE